MKRLLILPVLLLSLLVGNPAVSADFQKGLDAYTKGDFATALKELKPLAEQGNADAQNNLGLMYDEGKGVPQNDKTAVKWYTLAAEQGHAGAQNNLGLMYEDGKGVLQDYKTAVKWYTLADEQAPVSLPREKKEEAAQRPDTVKPALSTPPPYFSRKIRGGADTGKD